MAYSKDDTQSNQDFWSLIGNKPEEAATHDSGGASSGGAYTEKQRDLSGHEIEYSNQGIDFVRNISGDLVSTCGNYKSTMMGIESTAVPQGGVGMAATGWGAGGDIWGNSAASDNNTSMAALYGYSPPAAAETSWGYSPPAAEPTTLASLYGSGSSWWGGSTNDTASSSADASSSASNSSWFFNGGSTNNDTAPVVPWNSNYGTDVV